jgi:hypothetical protein
MTVTYGFYDSVSSDRVYNAEQMGRMFDGVLQDGIFAFEGNALEVIEYSGMTVQVESGRAWFNHTWTLNDANLDVVVPTAHATLNRIDIVYLETNKNSAVRANKIDILEGTPASSPVPPTLATGPEQYQYALAHIYVGAGVTSIYTANITDKRGIDTDYAVSGLYSYIEPLSVDTEHLATAAVTTAKVANNQITNSLLRDSAALSVIGRASNSVGDPADIVAGTDGYVLRRSGTSIGFGTLIGAALGNGIITIDHMAANSVDSAQYVDGSIDTVHLANNCVDDTKVGNRVAQVYRRQGGSSTNWATNGTNEYTPGAVRIQCGSGYDADGIATVGFPVAFSYTPVIVVTSADYTKDVCVHIGLITAGYFNIYLLDRDTGIPTAGYYHWLAIGPE